MDCLKTYPPKNHAFLSMFIYFAVRSLLYSVFNLKKALSCSLYRRVAARKRSESGSSV